MVFGVWLRHWQVAHGTDPATMRRFFEETSALGIGGVWVDCEPDRYGEGWQEYIQLAGELTRDFGFQVSAHAPGGDISSTNEKVRAEAVERIGTAIHGVGLGVPGVTIAVHPEDYKPPRVPGDDEARMEKCHESLESLAGVAFDVGAHIALENMRHRADNPNRTGMYVSQLSEIVADLDPATVGICVDTGHANISEQCTVAEAFSRNADRVIHVHYDDNFGVADQHLPPGEGEIDFDAFLNAAKDAQYEGMIELEVGVPEGEYPLRFWKRCFDYYRQAGGQVPG
jgi:sugar phosphate isomerase/epimerase